MFIRDRHMSTMFDLTNIFLWSNNLNSTMKPINIIGLGIIAVGNIFDQGCHQWVWYGYENEEVSD